MWLLAKAENMLLMLIILAAHSTLSYALFNLILTVTLKGCVGQDLLSL